MLVPKNQAQLEAPANALLAGLPSTAALTESKDLADTFSDLRAWVRRTGSQGGLSVAGNLLKPDQREAVLSFLERVTLDPIRKNVARELLAKLSADEAWCSRGVQSNHITESALPLRRPASMVAGAQSHHTAGSALPQRRPAATATGRSATVSGARIPADPIRHKLAQDFLDRLTSAPVDSGAPVAAACLPRGPEPENACGADVSNGLSSKAHVTETFCIPRLCHHIVVGKNGQDIVKLQETHAVAIRVPKLEDDCEAIAVTGLPSAVEHCRQALELLLHLPVGTGPLHKMMLGIPKASYGSIIGERGTTLHQLMRDCNVLIQVPKAQETGDVTVCGQQDGCLRAKIKIEEILRDTVPVLSSGMGARPVMPVPPSYDLAGAKSIQRCLFFPEQAALHPDDGLSSLGTLLKFLDSTRVSCDVCVFTITDNRIARRLLDAHRYRRVRVRIITDKVQIGALGSDIGELQAAGIEVRTNTSPHHMHHKFCILDGVVLLNGSFNWTQGACENNCENVMISNDKAFVSPFKAQFEHLWQEYR